jgi:8-oxo-dGTP diphosphatase
MLQVAAGILLRDQTVLVCRRRTDASHPLKWEFPGGKREAEESLRQCLSRELREELGIEARIGRLLWTTHHTYPDRPPLELSFFLVDSYEGNIVNHAFSEIRWVPIGSLHSLDFLEADRQIVDRLDRFEVSLSD